MLRIIKSSQYETDLIQIWRYVANDNPTAATRLLERIDARVSSLEHHPFLGEHQPKFGNNTRRLIEGNYLIYYDVLPDAVHVLRVFHAARKIEELFD
jgi:toxin ParE1/3/4